MFCMELKKIICFRYFSFVCLSDTFFYVALRTWGGPVTRGPVFGSWALIPYSILAIHTHTTYLEHTSTPTTYSGATQQRAHEGSPRTRQNYQISVCFFFSFFPRKLVIFFFFLGPRKIVNFSFFFFFFFFFHENFQLQFLFFFWPTN